MTVHTAPVSTYRLQLTPDFGFADAARLADYLADLGVTHAYLSPVLTAVPGSQHGYDVTDHSRIRDELGGEDAFRAMAARLRAAGVGIILDIVPNHMAVPADVSLNRQLWRTLRDGPESPYASWFDVDWAAGGGRMLMPILDKPVGESLTDLVLDPHAGPDGEPVLRYLDHVLPVRPETAGLPVAELAGAQHYRLASWQEAATELNWRRFFDITTLIGVRVEDPAVFAATHGVIAQLVAEGLVDGLRVDHPDGLADPREYLRRLAAATGGVWVIAEKILTAGERLPGDWPCAGTTGYDSLRLADGLFVDPDGEEALTAQYARFAGPAAGARPFTEIAVEAKREVADGELAAEVNRLARLLPASRPGSADPREVLSEVLAGFGVYRAYAYPGEPPSPAAREAVRSAVSAASGRLHGPSRELATTVGDLALGADESAWGFALRFQQTTGPVLAKGLEDTAFYRWPRLVSLNEVGGDPDLFGVRPAEFHAEAGRLADDWPATMTTLSTHDTKRQEDVRARLAVLTEIPGEWGQRVAQWHERAASLGVAGVDPDTEYLLWQTLVGAWPICDERLAAYLEKATREAKTHTSWSSPDPRYEESVLGMAAKIIADPGLSESIGSFVTDISADALANSLGVKLVQLTMPGVPDVYQGCELTGLSLVDPDNRRPVDYARRRALLADLDAGPPDATRLEATRPNATRPDATRPEADAGRLDTAKLLVTSRTLRLRRDHPDWFAGGYHPLSAVGPAADHALAFMRGGSVNGGTHSGAITVVTRLPAGVRRRGGWSDTRLPLGRRGWVDVLTGLVHRGGEVPLAELTRLLPVALLVPEAL